MLGVLLATSLAISPAQSVPPLSPPNERPALTPVRAPGGYRPAPTFSFDPVREAQRHRLRGVAWAGVGVAGVLTTTLMQARAMNGNAACVSVDDNHRACLAPDTQGTAFLHAAGLTVFGAASFGTMFAFGRARAYEDWRTGRPTPRPIFSYVAAGALIGASQAVLFSGLRKRNEGRECESEACRLRARAHQYTLIDLGAIGTAAGAAVLGFAVGREMQSRRLADVRIAPTLTRVQAGVAVSARF